MNTDDKPLTAEQQEVLKVIEADLACYMARDKESWQDNWVTDDRFTSIMECGTLQIADDFETFRQNIFEAMDAEPDEIKADVRRDNVHVHISGAMAWVTFDQIISDTRNPLALTNLSNNFRLLERRERRWRIVFHGVWSQLQREAQAPMVEVTAGCEVVWLNPNAASHIKEFGGLTVSNGTLRASTPTWDHHLREQVARAHELTAFAKYNRAAMEGGGSVTYPVVLGEDDEGALLVCWVKVADGRVYVLFGNNPDLHQQIEVARIIHALSDAQTEIIRLITRGLDIQQIAAKLDITTNTVKTHLKRAFEKVGVSSQVELIRKLVSFSV